MNKLIITLDLVQALVNYLQQRPFVEVFQIIAELSELPRYEESIIKHDEKKIDQ